MYKLFLEVRLRSSEPLLTIALLVQVLHLHAAHYCLICLKLFVKRGHAALFCSFTGGGHTNGIKCR